MVTYMVVWMRQHSRELKGQLESMASDAMRGTSRGALAMVGMAFLAVLREGFETVVFLLAAFNETGSSSAAGWGALAGILVAVALGYGIYRGGVRLNLSKFFRATGLVLVLVAAGLVVTALHTAHEAGWLNAGQGATVDLSGLVRPGTVQASLLTGMLGMQPHPVVIEVVGWLVYLIPVGLYVAWPPGRGPSRQLQLRAAFGVAALAAAAALVLALVAPSRPAQNPAGAGATLVSRHADRAVVRAELVSPAARKPAGPVRDIAVRRVGAAPHEGLATVLYRGTVRGAGATGRPTLVGLDQVARWNHGRLPIGAAHLQDAIVHYTDTDRVTLWVEPRTGRVIDVAWAERITAAVASADGPLALALPVASGKTVTGPRALARAAAAARADLDRIDRHNLLVTLAWSALAIALLAVAVGGAVLLAGRRARPSAPVQPTPAPSSALVRS
jgi:high-affinity iron transporter